MQLAAGDTLGPYRIAGLIGAGGMGEVYRARDTRLDRDVALKLLPEEFAKSAERLARFQREARTLASLNHPHIAQIYGLEEQPDRVALAMEFVEGEDLAQRLERGALPLDEILPIARQVNDALESAHAQGIIHRDLKPANIKVRSDGTVKVLDFGLAKAVDQASGAGSSGGMTMSPTMTSPAMTAAGVILGTAAYMSPEQARGKAVDKRADIWAFGCLLFEMLTGRRAFEGFDTRCVDPQGAVVGRTARLDASGAPLDHRALPAKRAASTFPRYGRCAALARWGLQRARDGGHDHHGAIAKIRPLRRGNCGRALRRGRRHPGLDTRASQPDCPDTASLPGARSRR
jgi:hypothetical protein